MEHIQNHQKEVVGKNKIKNRTVEPYLNLLMKIGMKIGIEPNFYVSEPYLNLVDARCYTLGSLCWLEAEGWTLFPVLSESLYPANMNFQRLGKRKMFECWCDFNGYFCEGLNPRFLDSEFIFDPCQFNDMTGGRWQIYRKNSRKWQRGHENWSYQDKFKGRQAQMLLGEWLDNKPNVEDSELMIRLCLEKIPGVGRKFLYHDGELKAINVWDENWRFVNYRVCIVKDEPWLSEFARLLFYTDPEIQSKHKLIHDGGSLGNEGLERFKDKMNPLIKRKRYSWIKMIK